VQIGDLEFRSRVAEPPTGDHVDETISNSQLETLKIDEDAPDEPEEAPADKSTE
jgi:hypothetical protein